MSNPGWADWQAVEKVDPEAAEAILAEVHRENSKIELIASENFSSTAVLAALGTPLTNKYAEGYPGKRYYGGCEYVDVVENLAIERAKKIFGAQHVNVQPHAGAQANAAAYFANPAAAKRPKPDRVPCPTDAELLRPISAGAQRDAYARAEACFARAIADGKRWDEIR